VAAAELRNFFLKNTDWFRVFTLETFYRRKGDVRGHPEAPHQVVARPGGHPCHPMVCQPPGPSPALLRTSSHVGKNRRFGLHFIQFREYFLCNFSKTQKLQKTGNWHCGISLIG
jgi:hypothetical protein